MARKIVEHIRKNKVSLDECEDAQEFVNQVTNPRRPGKATNESTAAASGNPFGGFSVSKPAQGAGMAQGGTSR